jgi:hypothetical protein
MLASTVQFSNNTHQPHPHPRPNSPRGISRISAIRNNHTPNQQGHDGVVSDTQQCVSSEPR